LRGTQIPLGARIFAIADTLDAMTSDRPYRKNLGTEEALRRLREAKNKQFDPVVVDALIECLHNDPSLVRTART
jgi:HD-GYP domain-containing protein (c-di-GMP phosphodiesterase class II)